MPRSPRFMKAHPKCSGSLLHATYFINNMHFMRLLRLLIPALFILLASCTPQRKLVYLQGDPAVLRDTTTFEMKLFPGDIISVELFTVNPEAFPGLGISSDHITGTDNRSAYEK